MRRVTKSSPITEADVGKFAMFEGIMRSPGLRLAGRIIRVSNSRVYTETVERAFEPGIKMWMLATTPSGTFVPEANGYRTGGSVLVVCDTVDEVNTLFIASEGAMKAYLRFMEDLDKSFNGIIDQACAETPANV